MLSCTTADQRKRKGGSGRERERKRKQLKRERGRVGKQFGGGGESRKFEQTIP
jgi:hypothetical protein